MSKEYKVGYKRPPQHTRFKKGKSGNPRGRLKNVQNLKSYLAEELESPITIAAQGKKKTVTKQQAFIMSLVARAIKGDPRAGVMLINMMRTMFPDVEQNEGDNMNASDHEIVAAYLQRHFEPEDKK